jgi:hypothetical protein
MDFTEHNRKMLEPFRKIIVDGSIYPYGYTINPEYQNNGKIDLLRSTFHHGLTREINWPITDITSLVFPEHTIPIIDSLVENEQLLESLFFKKFIKVFIRYSNNKYPEYKNMSFEEIAKNIPFFTEERYFNILYTGLDLLLYMIDKGYQIQESDFENINDNFRILNNSIDGNTYPALYTLDELKQHLYDYQANVNGQYVLK